MRFDFMSFLIGCILGGAGLSLLISLLESLKNAL